jgi:hypothetical protein
MHILIVQEGISLIVVDIKKSYWRKETNIFTLFHDSCYYA